MVIKLPEPSVWDGNATVDCFEKPGVRSLTYFSPFLLSPKPWGPLPLKTVEAKFIKTVLLIK